MAKNAQTEEDFWAQLPAEQEMKQENEEDVEEHNKQDLQVKHEECEEHDEDDDRFQRGWVDPVFVG